MYMLRVINLTVGVDAAAAPTPGTTTRPTAASSATIARESRDAEICITPSSSSLKRYERPYRAPERRYNRRSPRESPNVVKRFAVSTLRGRAGAGDRRWRDPRVDPRVGAGRDRAPQPATDRRSLPPRCRHVERRDPRLCADPARGDAGRTQAAALYEREGEGRQYS